jgi:peptidoglycan/LPS O-acetylase OafA/YrhL
MKKHLDALDGLRGLAAIAVLLFHLGRWLDAPWLAANGSLAVDLFFCLSGYVLPLAYLSRRDSLSNIDFLRLRAIRLMPLIVFGGLVSAAFILAKLEASHLRTLHASLTAALAGAMLNIPIFGAPHEIGGPEVFPLNGPQYTLFLELVANAVWWPLRKHISYAALAGVILVSAVLVALFGLGGDVPQTFVLGFPRVALSFSLGLVLYGLRERYRPSPAINTAIFVAAGLSTLTLFYAPVTLPIWVALIWIVAVGPALIISGTRLALPDTAASAARVLGALSYPIYALHYPLFCWADVVYRAKFGAQRFVTEAPFVCLVVVAGAYAALRLYDEPVRRGLTKFVERRQRRATSLTGAA